MSWYRGLIFLFFIVFYGEFLVYYVVLLMCRWPILPLNAKSGSENILKIMILADTHLLGVYRGHWFDRLKREWQMYRGFQSAISVFKPEAVFFLGDIFDEGHYSQKVQWEMYVKRFNSLFEVKEKTKRYVVIGNHDVGFHYAIHPLRVAWFEESFGRQSSVELVELKGNYFILLNSMAMEADGCHLCRTAQVKLSKLAKSLNCAANNSSQPPLYSCDKIRRLSFAYSRPILMQHYPLYRENDMNCSELDEAPPKAKEKPFRETWECLSQQSTQFLLKLLNPRAAFSGHSHYGCRT